LGGTGNGEAAGKNEVDGAAFDFGGKIGAGHDGRREKRLDYRTDDAENYRPQKKSRNNAVTGTLTSNPSLPCKYKGKQF
jgi:hypothetical protein